MLAMLPSVCLTRSGVLASIQKIPQKLAMLGLSICPDIIEYQQLGLGLQVSIFLCEFAAELRLSRPPESMDNKPSLVLVSWFASS